MRVFFGAFVGTILLAAACYFLLNEMQKPSGIAYKSESARIEPSWSWRSALTGSSATPCEARKTWQWFFVDFRRPNGEPRVCSDSQ
jgi:hypothetical protein